MIIGGSSRGGAAARQPLGIERAFLWSKNRWARLHFLNECRGGAGFGELAPGFVIDGVSQSPASQLRHDLSFRTLCPDHEGEFLQGERLGLKSYFHRAAEAIPGDRFCLTRGALLAAEQ